MEINYEYIDYNLKCFTWNIKSKILYKSNVSRETLYAKIFYKTVLRW